MLSFWASPVRCLAPRSPPIPANNPCPLYYTLPPRLAPSRCLLQDAGCWPSLPYPANLPRSSVMSFLHHALFVFVLVWLAPAPVLPVVATDLQDQTFGIDSTAVLFSTGWSTVSNAAGTFRETTGKANEVEIFLPGARQSFSHSASPEMLTASVCPKSARCLCPTLDLSRLVVRCMQYAWTVGPPDNSCSKLTCRTPWRTPPLRYACSALISSPLMLRLRCKGRSLLVLRPRFFDLAHVAGRERG